MSEKTEKFEDWWIINKGRYHGQFSDILLLKHNIRIGWDAHRIQSMTPLTEEIIVEASKIKESATELKDKIEKL